MTELAKMSDQPRFWALRRPSMDTRPYFDIFDRNRADRLCAGMVWSEWLNSWSCSWHGADYWHVDTNEWRKAVSRAIEENGQ